MKRYWNQHLLKISSSWKKKSFTCLGTYIVWPTLLWFISLKFVSRRASSGLGIFLMVMHHQTGLYNQLSTLADFNVTTLLWNFLSSSAVFLFVFICDIFQCPLEVKLLWKHVKNTSRPHLFPIAWPLSKNVNIQWIIATRNLQNLAKWLQKQSCFCSTVSDLNL